MIDLIQLNHSLAIAKRGSFAAAAKSLGLSQPTLSRQVGALEVALGVRLFDRGRHGAVPTPLGREILARAADLVRSAELLIHEVDLLRGVEVGDLKVGAGVYPAFLTLGTAVARLTARHPRLHVSVQVEDWRVLAPRVLEATLDLAIVETGESAGHPDLAVEPLPEHQGVFICRPGHPLLDRPAPGLAEVFRYPFAGTRLAPRVADFIDRDQAAGRVDDATGEYVPSIEVNTIRMVAEAVATSNAFGIVPLLTANELGRDGRVQALPLRPPWLKSKYGFITLRNRTLSPAAAAFMSEVRAVESELVSEELRLLQASGGQGARAGQRRTAGRPEDRGRGRARRR